MTRFKIFSGVLLLVSILVVSAIGAQVFLFGSGNQAPEDDIFVNIPEGSTIIPPRADSPESRYGFTINLSWTSSDSFLVRDVATGDLDGDGDQDIVSSGGTTCQVYMNDGTGTSFTKGWSASGLTGEATQVKVVDADGDTDNDIILMTQSGIPVPDLAAPTPVTGNINVYIYKNGGSGTFTQAATTSVAHTALNYHEYYWSGLSYMDVGDTNNDGNVDIAVAASSGANQNIVTYHIFSFDGTSTITTDSARVNTSTGGDGWIWGHVAFGDFDDNDFDDLAVCLSGFESMSSGPVRAAECYVFFNSAGTVSTTAQLVGQWNFQGANYGNYIYSLIAGDATDDGTDDIIVGTNYDLGGAYADGMVWVIEALSGTNFKKPAMWYQTTGHWQPRDMVLGSFDVDTGTDIITNYWFENSNPPQNFVIDTWSFEFGSGRQGSPVPKFLKKWEGKSGQNLPSGSIFCVDGADFDKASPSVDDVVVGGSKTMVFSVFYPPNNIPKIVNSSWTKIPILNDGKETTKLNLTVKDLDGSDRDLGDGSVLIDLSPVGGTAGTPMTNIAYDGALGVRFYHHTFSVAPTTNPGLVKLEVTVTDKCNEPYPGPAPGVHKENLTLTVEQFNRGPQISDNALFELELDEDQAPYTIPDISDFFLDPDGDDMTFDLGSDITTEYNSNILKAMYDDSDHSTRIIPLPNEHGFSQIPVRAHDGAMTTVHKINVTIKSINDAPVIHNTGSEDWKNNSFVLTQDYKFSTTIEASDVDGDDVFFSIEFDGRSKPLFPIDEATGEIEFWPDNSLVGNHKAFITADDKNTTNNKATKTFWFNVTNANDAPSFIKIGDYLINDTVKEVTFNVTEHEWVNFSMEATDPDIDIGLQDSVFYSSSLSLMNESFFVSTDEKNPTKGEVNFWAHGSGITCTVPERGYGPLTGKLTVTDSLDHTLKKSINVSFGIQNVNDPPSPAKIASPENNETFLTMEVEFVAGIVTDPDEIYGDVLNYTWDFNDEDGIDSADATGLQPKWEYEEPGDYIVTLTVNDKAGLSNYVQILVHVYGDPSGTDADGDGLPDAWEEQWGTNPYSSVGDDGYDGDPDEDGVPNWKEMEIFTDPFDRDTDGDGHWDGDDKYPNDKDKWDDTKEDPSTLGAIAGLWWLWLLIGLLILVIIVIVIIVVVLMSKKKQEEEEEARAIAEAAAQEDPYAAQELYSDTGQAEQQMAAQPMIAQPEEPAEPQEALEFDKPEGIEPVEPAGPGPESPDMALPPGQPGEAGPDMGAPGAEGAPPGGQQVQLPPQGGQPDLSPPPALPPAASEQPPQG